jgi:hypothetical protein
MDDKDPIGLDRPENIGQPDSGDLTPPHGDELAGSVRDESRSGATPPTPVGSQRETTEDE